MNFKDHFSGHADQYARFRPKYPDALFAYLADQAPRRQLAWDCATGSGQAATALAVHFNRVVATDASENQIKHATQHERVDYRVSPAEASDLDSCSLDLITVAQAVHWFQHEAFYKEVRRCLRPNGVLAVWAYERMEISPEIDLILYDFYDNIVGPFWPPEREYVKSRYKTLPFDLPEIAAPPFFMNVNWSLPRLLGYLETWSAVQRYMEKHEVNPILSLNASLLPFWGEPDTARLIRWPLILKIGKLPGPQLRRATS